MAVMDEFREERAKIKNADLKTKIIYYVGYYKWHTVVFGLIASMIITLAYGWITAKDTAFQGYMINIYEYIEMDTDLATSFGEYAQIDLNEYEIFFDTSLQMQANSVDAMSFTSTQKMMAALTAKEIDFIAGTEEAFLQNANTKSLHDLRDILSEEKLEQLSDYLYYIDMDVLRQKEEYLENFMEGEFVEKEYDHFKPEEMVDPVPIALDISKCPKFMEFYYHEESAVPMGIVLNSERVETTLQFIDYLFEDLIQ